MSAQPSSFIEKHEVQEAKDFINKNLGFNLDEHIRPTGYHMLVKIYVRSEDVHQVKDEKGNPILGANGKPMFIALPETVSANDRYRNCSALVLEQGTECYKTGRFKPKKGFMEFTTLEKAIQCAEFIESSIFCPPQYKGKRQDILTVIQLGMELGFEPMESLVKLEIKDGQVLVKEAAKDAEKKDNIIRLYEESRVKPWCNVGDWIVIPRNEGTQINCKGIPMQLIPDDRCLAIIKEPSDVTRD